MKIEILLALVGPLYLVAVAWPLSRIDIKQRRLPNRLVLPAFPIALVSQVSACAIGGQWWRIAVSIGLAAVALVIGVLINRTAALGMGDVKLISAMFLTLGWFSAITPLVALVIGFVSAAVVVLGLVALRKTQLGSTIALGPYLLFGFTGALVSSQILG